jgi:hypothetical protein
MTASFGRGAEACGAAAAHPGGVAVAKDRIGVRFNHNCSS